VSGEVRADVAAAILERAARGQSWLRIGRELSVPAAVAELVAQTFGHPSRTHMASAVNNLRGLGRELVTYGTDAPGSPGAALVEAPLSLEARQPLKPQLTRVEQQTNGVLDERIHRNAKAATQAALVDAGLLEAAAEQSPAELVEATVRQLSVDQLLERAAASGRGSVRADGARAAALLERIRRALIDDELAMRTRARVAELRRELAKLEGRAAAPGRERLECTAPGCHYSTVQPARFAAHTAAHEETTTHA
jgi:hypothetical protein